MLLAGRVAVRRPFSGFTATDTGGVEKLDRRERQFNVTLPVTWMSGSALGSGTRGSAGRHHAIALCQLSAARRTNGVLNVMFVSTDFPSSTGPQATCWSYLVTITRRASPLSGKPEDLWQRLPLKPATS